MKNGYVTNPVIESDFPDPDIIRVGDTYYMVSTTMYYMPGGDILRSKDMLRWELAGHIYDTLEDSPAHRLEDGRHIFSAGMWAPCIRYNNGKFYVNFACNDSHKTYLFISDSPEGPWQRREMGGFFHDSSLFFDDDGRVYIIYGNTELHLTELDPETWAPKVGGLDRIAVKDREGQPLGYEGSHLYKHEGRYYLFTCHMPKGDRVIKTEDCFIADSLEGEFTGKEILRDDMGHRGLGVAQGGMVDTPDGKWFLFMFQDRGALGRAPVMMPMEFDSEGYPRPVLTDGKLPNRLQTSDTAGSGGALYGDSFCDDNGVLMPYWQFSHNPDREHCVFPDRNRYRVTSAGLSDNLLLARNTLTQRCFGPSSAAYVTVSGKDMNSGDRAGLCIYISPYSAIALTRLRNGFAVELINSPADDSTFFGMKDFLRREPQIIASAECGESVEFKAESEFETDTVRFYYKSGGEWILLGEPLRTYFKMDLFTGSRFGLFMYSTEQTGGTAEFSDFRFIHNGRE